MSCVVFPALCAVPVHRGGFDIHIPELAFFSHGNCIEKPRSEASTDIGVEIKIYGVAS